MKEKIAALMNAAIVCVARQDYTCCNHYSSNNPKAGVGTAMIAEGSWAIFCGGGAWYHPECVPWKQAQAIAQQIAKVCTCPIVQLWNHGHLAECPEKVIAKK